MVGGAHFGGGGGAHFGGGGAHMAVGLHTGGGHIGGAHMMGGGGGFHRPGIGWGYRTGFRPYGGFWPMYAAGWYGGIYYGGLYGPYGVGGPLYGYSADGFYYGATVDPAQLRTITVDNGAGGQRIIVTDTRPQIWGVAFWGRPIIRMLTCIWLFCLIIGIALLAGGGYVCPDGCQDVPCYGDDGYHYPCTCPDSQMCEDRGLTAVGQIGIALICISGFILLAQCMTACGCCPGCYPYFANEPAMSTPTTRPQPEVTSPALNSIPTQQPQQQQLSGGSTATGQPQMQAAWQPQQQSMVAPQQPQYQPPVLVYQPATVQTIRPPQPQFNAQQQPNAIVPPAPAPAPQLPVLPPPDVSEI